MLALAGGALWLYSLGPLPRLDEAGFSTEIVDRDGRLLRPYSAEEGRWRLKASVADADPRFVTMLIAYEDKRFHSHHGVDPSALARAAWLLVVERTDCVRRLDVDHASRAAA